MRLRHASITSFKVTGSFALSTVVAGINPGDDFTWGGGADSAADVAGIAIAGIKPLSKIGVITLGAATTSDGAKPVSGVPGTHLFAIESITLTSIQVGKLPATKSFTSALWLDANRDGMENDDEVLVRKLS